MWVAACSWKMEAEADKTCFLGDSKEESEVLDSKEELELCDSKEELEVSNIKEKLEAEDKSRSFGEELELCNSKQVEVEVCHLKEDDISCFLCDSKEDLELCNKCNLVVTCSHHVNLHR